MNEDFVARDDTYNLKVGGDGGWDFCNRPENHNNKGNHRKTGFCYMKDEIGRNPGRATVESYSNEEFNEYRKRISIGVRRFLNEHGSAWVGRKHKEETKKKISEKNKISQLGSKNSQFGTKCMFNESLKKTIHVKSDEVQKYLDDGWKLGAVYNWESYFKRPIGKRYRKHSKKR